ncbi:hypothetical protein GIS00_23150 [Nakamurella sp. YIM 132087]|uniref:Ankyrin repeat domain-containing protein n=2 Tax=Nakamurella alba TaxID=2665158 RepID=A0A7K1FRR9_9ACTN|nr:hypothetical protein [Nakamurella alba]
MFRPSDDHLQLLFEFGLGTGDGGSWHRRLPEVTDDPAGLLEVQLAWAVTHRMPDRVRLLAGHGVPIDRPLRRGYGAGNLTPVQLAARIGDPGMVRLLVDLGAPASDDPVSTALAVLLDGDGTAIAALDPAVVTGLRRTHPSLVLRAAVNDRPDVVTALVGLGWDVNAYGRQDAPIEEKWETALHHAAGEGKADLARHLLALGADPTLTDRRFSATPAGWAAHLGHPDLAAALEQAVRDRQQRGSGR